MLIGQAFLLNLLASIYDEIFLAVTDRPERKPNLWFSVTSNP
jgi:hypothetical protein